jgi:hypothetical protein
MDSKDAVNVSETAGGEDIESAAWDELFRGLED